MEAARYDFTINLGSDFLQEYQILLPDGVTPLPLTGYSFESKLRLSASDPTVLATFTMAVPAPLLGKFTQALTNSVTAAIPVAPSESAVRTITEAAYDIEMTDPGGTKTRIVQGIAFLSPEVTR